MRIDDFVFVLFDVMPEAGHLEAGGNCDIEVGDCGLLVCRKVFAGSDGVEEDEFPGSPDKLVAVIDSKDGARGRERSLPLNHGYVGHFGQDGGILLVAPAPL